MNKKLITLLMLGLYITIYTTQNGTLDTTFGLGKGYVTHPNGFFASSISIGTNDGIIVGGSSSQNTFQIAYYNDDGTMNNTFGTNGIVNGPAGLLFDILITPDEYILASGQDISGNLLITKFYKEGGYIDSNFGINGIVTANEGFCSAIAQQTDLYIIAGGGTADGKFLLLRFTPDGTLDTMFESGPEGFIEDLIIQENGKIVACGVDLYGRFSVVRYNPDGSIDTDFGINGIATGPQGMATCMGIQPNGYIVIGGYDLGSAYDINVPNKILITRLDTNGIIDYSFGINGVINSLYGVINALALQPDGKIVVAGSQAEKTLVARFNINGSLDTTFNETGYNTLLDGLLYGVGLQKNGNIIAVGIDQLNSNFLVARYISTNPIKDTIVLTPLASSYGSIIIGGTAQRSSNIYVYIDGEFVGGTTTIPLSNLWSFSTTIKDSGMYTIRAVATYQSGSSTSAGTNRMRIYGS